LKDLIINNNATLHTPDSDNEVEIETWSFSGDVVSVYVPFEKLEKWVASVREQIIKDSRQTSC